MDESPDAQGPSVGLHQNLEGTEDAWSRAAVRKQCSSFELVVETVVDGLELDRRLRNSATR
jgi:hypothetical protein